MITTRILMLSPDTSTAAAVRATPRPMLSHVCTTLLVVLGLLAFVGLSPLQTQAQEVDITPGIKGGVNFADLGGDDAELIFDGGGSGDFEIPIEARTGIVAGGFALIDFDGPFALQPEVLYVQKGAKVEIEFLEETASSTLKLDYIEVPVLAKFQIPLEGSIAPNIFAGPAVAFNITAEQEGEGPDGSETTDLSEVISTTDFGLQVGAGVDFDAGPGTIMLDAWYELGLSSIPSEGDADIKNQGIRITAGFGF